MSDFQAPNPAHSEEYRALRRRVRDVVSSADAASLDAIAPATPKWRIRDVLAHMVGVVDDASNQRLDGVTTEPWTQAQVDARAEATVAEMLDEWDRIAPGFEEVIAQMPAQITGQVLFDAVTHEHDIRHAVGAPGARDVPAIDMVFDWVVWGRSMGGAPKLRFDVGGEVVESGSGDDVVATVTASRFELVRAITGRRSRSEIEAYGWDPPADAAVLLAAPIFSMRDEPLNE
jgi:uncharacterized protein (TIGR03083 family)